jgi:hypothetical protein
VALPLSLDLVNVHGRYARLDNSNVTGTVTFTPQSGVLTDAASLTAVLPAPITAQVYNGQFSIDLPATDDPDLSPTGWTYLVHEGFPGGRADYQITVPVAAKPTGVDVNAVAPSKIPASTGSTTYVLAGTFAALEATAVRSDTIRTVVTLTQAEYDALPGEDPATLYVITS